MVPQTGIEPISSVFQTAALTTVASEASNVSLTAFTATNLPSREGFRGPSVLASTRSNPDRNLAYPFGAYLRSFSIHQFHFSEHTKSQKLSCVLLACMIAL